MENADLILQFDVAEGRSPDVEIVANALLAWVDTLRATAAVVDPDAGLIVELVGVEPGSQRFRQILRRIEAGADRLQKGGDEFPLIKKAAITLGGLVVAGTIAAGINIAMEPDPRIPDDQMKVFHEINANLRRSVQLQAANQRFYRIIAEEPAIRSLKVFHGEEGKGKRAKLAYEIPREEFLIRSGLWGGEINATKNEIRPRMVTWEVVLVKPVLIGRPRRWTFARDGLEFSALMVDPMVLEAIRDRRLRTPLAEGVIMKIEMHYRERFDGQSWRPVATSREVKRVLSPLPPPPSVPLFPAR